MTKYPEGLLTWSGDKAGGVKKLFYKGSGRPSGDVITTGLLTRLQTWAHDIGCGKRGTPTAIFLVGGPGNGKTEAVEFTVRELDASLHLDGALLDEFASLFASGGEPPGRLVRTTQTQFPAQSKVVGISIVQDGSETDRDDPTTPAEHLCDDIRSLLKQFFVVRLSSASRAEKMLPRELEELLTWRPTPTCKQGCLGQYFSVLRFLVAHRKPFEPIHG